jgi:hypothetical protein
VEKNPLRAFMWGEIAAEKSPMSESEKKTIREMAEKALTPEELQQARTMLLGFKHEAQRGGIRV